MAVAVPEDTTCLTFRLCYEGTLEEATVLTCGAGARFDRADGSCVPAANALCPGGGGGPVGPSGCPAGVTGNVLVAGTCNQFITCVNGVQAGEAITCANNWHFNPTLGNCDFPENLVPPCVAPANNRYVPKAPEITRVPSFRERLAKKLHL